MYNAEIKLYVYLGDGEGWAFRELAAIEVPV